VWLRRGSIREVILHIGSLEQSGYTGRSQDQDFHTTSAVRYNVAGNRFELHGHPPGTFSVEVSYERVPPRLFIGEATNVNHVDANSTFELLYASNPLFGEMDREPGRYLGTRLQSIAGGLRTIREIIDWAVDTTKVTVTLRGQATEILDSTQIATIPGFPEDFHHLIALGGACQAAATRGAAKLYSMLKQQRDEAFQQAIILLEQRLSEPRYVNETN
jgi:hypothetical protein